MVKKIAIIEKSDPTIQVILFDSLGEIENIISNYWGLVKWDYEFIWIWDSAHLGQDYGIQKGEVLYKIPGIEYDVYTFTYLKSDDFMFHEYTFRDDKSKFAGRLKNDIKRLKIKFDNYQSMIKKNLLPK